MFVRVFFPSLLSACLGFFFAYPSGAATVFQDGFESGSLGPAWSVSTTGDGRVALTSDYEPASGQWHLVLDDRVNDALYSVAESTLQLDLSNKKNVVLSFKAKSLGNEPDYPAFSVFPVNREFDGVSISTDGGATWRIVESLAAVGLDWETFTISLDDEVRYNGGAFGSDFRIRFSEFDNATAPLDGLAIDDVTVMAEDDQRVVLEIPRFVVEGSGPHIGYALLAFAPATTLRLTLSTSPSGQIITPAAVDVPAGQTIASFSFSVVDDSLVNLSRWVTVNAAANGVTSTPAFTTIFDDESPAVTLTVPPQLREGVISNDNASVSLDRIAAVPFELYLAADPPGEIQFPYSVTIPAGQTQAVFTVNAIDDGRIDGDVDVSISVLGAGVGGILATNHLTTVDNETRALSVVLPDSVQEGTIGTGIVRISGTLATNLEVSLASSNATALAVPAVVTIPAWNIEVIFPLTAADNSLRDGSREVAISAHADTFASGESRTTIRDNEVAGYRFSSLSTLVDASIPVNITISAADVEGNIISGFAGAINLSVVLPGGETQPATPALVELSGTNGWTGSVIFPPGSSGPLRLRATDALGNSGESVAFDIMKVLDLRAADLAWDGARNRLYATVPGNDDSTNANRVVVIDPLTTEIAGSVLVGQDPGQLVLTSQGENLYVALNGNGSIARINPATLSVASTFAVGTSPSYGTLYAADMCAVAGQPNLLVVSQKRKSVSPEHNGVAVYDNGVARPAKTQDHTGSNLIEPSADPDIFFGYNTETTEFGFRRLRLDASGMTQLEVRGDLVEGFGINMRSDGNKVFFGTGAAVDGTQMRRLGTFPASGVVCPDLAANRVYFIESREPYYYYYDSFDTIGAYDSATFSNIRKLKLPSPIMSPRSLIRWGTNGLAFITSSNVILITSSRLVPSAPPANLAVTVTAAPSPAVVSTPIVYTVCVSNQGPNTARGTLWVATVSADQIIQNVSYNNGTATLSSNNVTLPIGDLPAGTCAWITVAALPQSAGVSTFTASATSEAIDSDFSDNSAAAILSVGFHSTIDTINKLRLAANNLVYDPTRNLLWASIPDTEDAPLGKSIVSIDPTTGLISSPIPLNANPTKQCMALSTNGRYLYVGLTDVPEVHRLDLVSGFASVRIPLGLNQWSDAGHAEDIEPLDGDGTSFLVTTYGDNGAAVFDGAVRRPIRSGIYTVDRIERTATAGVFIGYANSISSFQLSRLAVTSSGVVITQSVNNLLGGYSLDIRGAGNLVLSESGLLVNSSNLTLQANLGVSGSPCLDLPNHRAYLVSDSNLRAFDTATTLPAGTLPLPVVSTYRWAQTCVRWGLDGFAILGDEGEIYVLRWSSAIPAGIDANADGLPDSWEATYFGRLTVDPAGDEDGDSICNFQEYLFGTSPLQPSINPTQVSAMKNGGQTVLRLVFPRRAGLSPPPYKYVISPDLTQWSAAEGVSETVLSTQTIGGVAVEMIEARIPGPSPEMGFVRLKWSPRQD